MTAHQARPIVPVILSGGSGTRLWPLSRLGRPKQLIAVRGERTMIQETALRVGEGEAFAPALVVAGEDHADAVEAQLGEAGAPPAALILEPEPRGTAAAAALAALEAGAESLILIMPSDHDVADPEALRAAVASARGAAEAGWLVAFGIAPDRAETGYGWIRSGEAVGEGLFGIATFAEKPDAARAQAWLDEGGWSWNAGIFLFSAAAYLRALEALAPELLAAVRAAHQGAVREGLRVRPDAEAFARAPSASIDRAVMEKAGKTAVVPVEMGWSDIGSWEALHALGPADAAGNVLSGDVVAVDSKGCLIRSDGPVVVTLGATNLIVVATERAVLVAPLGQGQRVKEAIDALMERAGRTEEG